MLDMNKPIKTNVTDTAEKLMQKYLERRTQLPLPEEKASQRSDETVRQLIPTHRSNGPSKDLTSYRTTLHELFKAISNYPDQFSSDGSLHGSDEDCMATSLQNSQLLFTETDVTLPSYLDASSGSQQTKESKLRRARQLSESCFPSSLLAKVYQEMMTIYEQLKAERQSQQQWETQLQEREKRVKQQEEALWRLTGLEEVLHTQRMSVEEKHQQELSQLQDLLRERNKENRRLRSSFDTIKELNDSMKKQLNEIIEQNKKLESQSKRVQARLENLQRKYENSMALRNCHKVSTECVKATKKEKTSASIKPSNKGSSGHTSLKLLALLLDWLLDGQTFPSIKANNGKDVGQFWPPEIILNERCLKVLPLLADQLSHNHLSEPGLLLNLLRFIHWALRHIEENTQHVALFATLRRIGETVSKPSAQPKGPQSEDPGLHTSCSDGAGGSSRNWPLYQSPCPHTRILSTLIILRTVTQADVLAQALDSLYTELMCEESRGLFLHYGGVRVLLSALQAGRGGLQLLIDILMQLTEHSRYLNPFLEECSCEEFFRTASQLLKSPHLELPSLEKLSILLQKLSSIRKNRHLFELSSLHHQIQELHHKTNHTQTFLCLNLRSILQNLK